MPPPASASCGRAISGVVAIDLGWWGYERSLSIALRELGAKPGDVRAVFLTHSHRDHVAAWRVVQHARFHIATAEHARLLGDSAHRGWIPALADRVKPSDLPRSSAIDLHMFDSDTTFVIGTDTLRAYVVPGHTAGTAVYLFRGVLFLGDAATYSRWGGFAPAKRWMSDDTRVAAGNLERLWTRLPAGGVRYVCTAHAHCTTFSADFLRDVAR